MYNRHIRLNFEIVMSVTRRGCWYLPGLAHKGSSHNEEEQLRTNVDYSAARSAEPVVFSLKRGKPY